MIKKLQFSQNLQVNCKFIIGGFSFNQNLEKNEKSSKSEAKKGIVSNMLSGIEKKGSIFGTAPSLSDHINSIKIVPSPNRKYIVSYDINGVIHFWE